jgi:hypothetical protein
VRSTWREQVGVGAEVALERVLEDHEPVRGAVAGDGRAVVLAVGAHLRTAVGDDHRHVVDHLPLGWAGRLCRNRPALAPVAMSQNIHSYRLVLAK